MLTSQPINLTAERSKRAVLRGPAAVQQWSPERRVSEMLLSAQLGVDEVRGRVGTVYLLPARYDDLWRELEHAAQRYLWASRRLQVAMQADGFGADDGQDGGAA